MAFYVEVLEHCINLLTDQAHDFIRPVRYDKVSVCPLFLKPPFLLANTTFFSRGAQLWLPLQLHLQSSGHGLFPEAGDTVSILAVKKKTLHRGPLGVRSSEVYTTPVITAYP